MSGEAFSDRGLAKSIELGNINVFQDAKAESRKASVKKDWSLYLGQESYVIEKGDMCVDMVSYMISLDWFHFTKFANPSTIPFVYFFGSALSRSCSALRFEGKLNFEI